METTLARRLIRSLCYILYYAFARHLPVSYMPYAFGAKRIRYWICKHMFAKCGKNVNVEHGAVIGSGRHIEIGDNSGIGVNCRVAATVRIGQNVMMGPDVVILSGNHNFGRLDIPMNKQGGSPQNPVTIEDDVWIGTRAIILPGRRIGKGSIIGAGSVVTKNIEPYSIVGGNPARVIGSRQAASPPDNREDA